MITEEDLINSIKSIQDEIDGIGPNICSQFPIQVYMDEVKSRVQFRTHSYFSFQRRRIFKKIWAKPCIFATNSLRSANESFLYFYVLISNSYAMTCPTTFLFTHIPSLRKAISPDTMPPGIKRQMKVLPSPYFSCP